MKIEPRGKYPGVKIHFDKEECEILLDLVEYQSKLKKLLPPGPLHAQLTMKMAKSIYKLKEEMPTLLEDRTEEEIHATLSKELIESEQKLAAIGKGADWKKIKVEVVK